MTQVNAPEIPQVPGVPGGAPQIPGGAPVPAAAPEIPAAAAPQGASATTTAQGNNSNSIVTVGRVNMPTTQLFEATGFVDISKRFPTSNAFLTFIPGQPDNTKQSGRTYVQDQRETMKVANRDLFALAEAIKFAAMYNQCDFTIFTDSSKFAGNNGQGINKRVSVSAAPSKKDPNKYLVFISYKGNASITIALEKWMAIGLAEELKSLADATEKKKFEIENSRGS